MASGRLWMCASALAPPAGGASRAGCAHRARRRAAACSSSAAAPADADSLLGLAPFEQPGGAGVVLALGKFDALHRGHRELALRASATAAAPYLLSFTGMAAELGCARRE